MQILHTTSFMNQEFASDAHIFSFNQISEDTASDLALCADGGRGEVAGGFSGLRFSNT